MCRDIMFSTQRACIMRYRGRMWYMGGRGKFGGWLVWFVNEKQEAFQLPVYAKLKHISQCEYVFKYIRFVRSPTLS